MSWQPILYLFYHVLTSSLVCIPRVCHTPSSNNLVCLLSHGISGVILQEEELWRSGGRVALPVRAGLQELPRRADADLFHSGSIVSLWVSSGGVAAGLGSFSRRTVVTWTVYFPSHGNGAKRSLTRYFKRSLTYFKRSLTIITNVLSLFQITDSIL